MDITNLATLKMCQNIVDGTTPPKRAIADEDGKNFKDYYALKSELSQTIIETTETDLNNLPLEPGIYKNENGFTANCPIRNWTPFSVNQEIYSDTSTLGKHLYIVQRTTGSGTVFKRVGSYYEEDSTISWSAWKQELTTSGDSYATRLGTDSAGGSTPSIPIYLEFGQPKACSLPYSNENLLINPDFKINQRGQTSYNNRGVYTVDRWINWLYPRDSLSPVVVTDNGLTLNNGSQAATVLQQIIENDSIKEKTLTLSAYVSQDGENYSLVSVSGIMSADETKGYFNWGELDFGINLSGYCFVNIRLQTNTQLYVKYIKLENGDIATPFVAPDITTELLKCYRYYYKLADNTPYSGWFFSDTSARINIVTPVKMRTDNPTLITDGELSNSPLYGGGTIFHPSAYSLMGARGNSLTVNFTISSGKTNYACAWCPTAAAPAAFDAEI